MLENLKKIQFPISKDFNNEKVAVAITAYDRPEYYKQCVHAINKCPELEQVPIFIFLDGGSKSKSKENLELSKNIKFKNKFVLKRNVNFGCEKNILDVFKTIFEDLEFDYLFLLEDDIVVGKNYFKSCFEAYKDIYNNIDKTIGIFQGHSLCQMPTEEKKRYINNYELSGDLHHWGILISKKAYNEIKIKLKQYIDLIFSLPNDGNSNINIIKNKFIINNIFDNILNNSTGEIPNKIYKDYYNKQNSHCTLGWDGAFLICLLSCNMKRYNFVVNRMINIGREGSHFSKKEFEQMNLHKMELEELW